MNDLIIEAGILTKYIAGKPGNPVIYEQYASGVSMLKLDLNAREERIMRALKQYPFLLPLCDSGLAILSPQGAIRKRLLLMLALIETDKNFTGHFINNEDASFAFIRFMTRGCIGVLKAAVGIILILLMRWK